MKVHSTAIFLICALFFCMQARPVSGFEIARNAYQAEYKLTSNLGMSQHLLAFDGNGHGRSEIGGNGTKNVSIIDYNQRKILILMAGMKSAMTIPLTDAQLSAMGSITEKMKAGAKPLGFKTIAGHPCTGTRYNLEGGAVEELWNGNDIGGVRVYSKVIAPGAGVSEALLVKFNPSAPSASLFTIPAGYSVN